MANSCFLVHSPPKAPVNPPTAFATHSFDRTRFKYRQLRREERVSSKKGWEVGGREGRGEASARVWRNQRAAS